MVDEVAPLIDAMLRSETLIKGAVVHERLVAEYGFTSTYQRVKLYMQEARPRIAEELGISPGELADLHRRFEVVPGAQAQVDWGDEGQILAAVGGLSIEPVNRVGPNFSNDEPYNFDPFAAGSGQRDLAEEVGSVLGRDYFPIGEWLSYSSVFVEAGGGWLLRVWAGFGRSVLPLKAPWSWQSVRIAPWSACTPIRDSILGRALIPVNESRSRRASSDGAAGRVDSSS